MMLPAGCGGSAPKPAPKPAPDPGALVTQALYSYLRAQSQGDGATACALLTASGQNELAAVVVKKGDGLITSSPSCLDAVGLVHTFAGAKLLHALATARVEQVRVSGSSATAEVVDGTAFRPEQVRLVKSGAAWKIDAVPGLG